MQAKPSVCAVRVSVLSLAGVCAASFVGSAHASFILPSSQLPPQANFGSTDNVNFLPTEGMDNLNFFGFSTQIAPPTLGNNAIASGMCSITLDLSISGGPLLSYAAVGAYAMKFTHDSDIGSTMHFNTEMLQLDISGGSLPPGVLLREAPTQFSLGVTTMTPMGGGDFQIDSYFDVFMELSLNGGKHWSPASGSVHATAMPAPGALSLLGLGLLGGTPRRRR